MRQASDAVSMKRVAGRETVEVLIRAARRWCDACQRQQWYEHSDGHSPQFNERPLRTSKFTSAANIHSCLPLFVSLLWRCCDLVTAQCRVLYQVYACRYDVGVSDRCVLHV